MTPETTKPRTFDSLRAAATALRLPLRLIQTAKRAGCTAFRSNRVYEAELLQALEAHPEWRETAEGDPRDEKLQEEIRKLRMANDAKEGRLIERAIVAEKIQRCAQAVNALRSKSEAEHPTRFAAAAGDVAECRVVVKQIWDEIFRDLAALAKHFEETEAA